MTEPLDDARGELLACPFCGERPTTMGSGEGQRGLMIECITPHCVNPHTSYYDHASARRVWNRRATPARCDAESAQCCRGLASESECRCEQERKAAGHAPYHRSFVPPPSEAGREEIIEQCAKVCDAHAKWAEDKIEDDPTSTRSQIFAGISNTSNDCAEMVRDLKRALSPDPGTVAVASADYCTPDGSANCEAWAVDKRCSSCPITSPDQGTAP